MPALAEALISRRIPFALEKPCGVSMSQVSGGERVYDPIVIAEAGIALSAECPKQEHSNKTQSDGSGSVYFQSAGAR